jgi:hypothetical protein
MHAEGERGADEMGREASGEQRRWGPWERTHLHSQEPQSIATTRKLQLGEKVEHWGVGVSVRCFGWCRRNTRSPFHLTKARNVDA